MFNLLGQYVKNCPYRVVGSWFIYKTVHAELLALGLYTKLSIQSCWLLVYIQNCPYRVVNSWFIYKIVHTELLALGLYTKLSIQSCWLLVYIQFAPGCIPSNYTGSNYDIVAHSNLGKSVNKVLNKHKTLM